MNKRVLTVTLNPAVDFTMEVPDFRIDEVNRASSGRRDPGGKGINLATALSQGGVESAVTGFLGRENADIFQKHFAENNLDDQFVYVDGPTREGIKIVDPGNGITTDINFKGFHLKTDEIAAFITKFAAIVGDYDYVVMAGSIPAGVPATIYTELAEVAREAGVFVAVDTSGPGLKKLIDSGFADLIKPNIDELREIYPEVLDSLHDSIDSEHSRGNKDPLFGLMEELLKKITMVALTMGGDGSRLYSPEGILEANAAKIIVKSTVGAGDTFLAGFIGGLAREMSLEESLRNAVCWTSSKLTIFGPGLSGERPPESFADEIVITEITR